MRNHTALLGVLLTILVGAGLADAQGPQGRIEERVALENEAVRVAVLTFEPGSASGRHVASRRRWGSWSRESSRW
jgi:hypothetical protein